MSDQFASIAVSLVQMTTSALPREDTDENVAAGSLCAPDRVEAVTLALSDFIARSRLRPGDRLPAERELMQVMAVGRSTVREVIRQFQARGVLEARKGSGTYLVRVVSPSTIHMPLMFNSAVLRDNLLMALEVRRGVEVEASAVAAQRRTDADLELIEAKLLVMEAAHHARNSAGPEDLAFHLAIYDATHNALFGQVLEQIRETFVRFFAEPFGRSDFGGRSFPFHRDLFEAVAARDAMSARAKTIAILAIVEEDVKAMSR